MLIIYTIAATLAAIIWFAATVRQTLRAERAEAALARIEATLAEIEREAILAKVEVPNALAVGEIDVATGVSCFDIGAVYLDGEKVTAYAYNIAEGWIDIWLDGVMMPFRKRGTVTVKLGGDR